MDKDTIKETVKETVKQAPKKIKNIFSKENLINTWNKIKNFRITRKDVHGYFESLQLNGKSLIVTIIISIIVMGFLACAVFFSNIKGAEKVMVPEVRGKLLETALIELRAKELYPEITLRYSEIPGDEGTILEQNPIAGSIVKGYRRVSLVVSRGVVVDELEDFVGQNLDDVKMKLQTLFAGSSKPLIVLANPEYKADRAEAGTILEQDPPMGTKISEPVTVTLVVSRGPSYDNTRVPNLVGNSVNDMLQLVARSRIIFDFTSHKASGSEKAGTVVSQEAFEEEFIPNYSRMNVELALPAGKLGDEVYGIFDASLTNYPYPVPMRIDAALPDGNTYTLVNFLHTGASLTVPYAVPSGTVLTLYVVDKEAKKVIVQ